MADSWGDSADSADDIPPSSIRDARDVERAYANLNARTLRHSQRLAAVERQMAEGTLLFQSIDRQMAEHAKTLKSQGADVRVLVQRDDERRVREQTLDVVAKQQQAFWRYMTPVIVTLLFGLVGATVWVATRLHP
jgi:septal ring factor EnvC (AmiA/AmiB activator)